MTEPIQGISKADGVERRRNATQERLRRLYGNISHADGADEEDSVDISEEARKKSDGTYRKSILEHLGGDE